MTAPRPPLAHRLRPKSLDEFAGQTQVLGADSPVMRALERGFLPPLILHGPPGCGKTAFCHLLAAKLGARLTVLSGSNTGSAEIRAALPKKSGDDLFSAPDRALMLFIDEIHRLSRTQQEVLLPHLEEGGFYFAAATTENPNFVLAKGLVSRALLLRFEKLEPAQLDTILARAIAELKSADGIEMSFEPAARQALLKMCAGDARRLLNAVELLSLETIGRLDVGLEHLSRLPESAVRYDRAGDDHYDVISAFIKSMRGGDENAVLYWLARMLASGEDPRFVARRIVICAAEDVGLANPHALVVAASAFETVEKVGMPEARIPLAESALYVARSPKSNSAYAGIDAALAAVKEGDLLEVPIHLRGDPYTAEGYIYPHTDPQKARAQKYLPELRTFYRENPLDRPPRQKSD